ncbi:MULTISPECIES: hypothetical protein [Peribacillus]|uniref:hypothetical protein n=1 Tax=Peribacillus TaxID=2675229 RepID=UPI00333D5709
MIQKMKSLLFLSLILVLGAALLPSHVFAAEGNSPVTGAKPVERQPPSLDPIEIKEITFKINKNLSDEQIIDRFEEINSKYNINEPFSLEDTEFIRAYASSTNETADIAAQPTNLIQPISLKFGNTNSQSFSKSKSKYGVTVKFTGKVYTNINVLNHSYRGNLKATIPAGSSKVKGIKTAVTNVAYGVLGKSGTYVGIVYSGSAQSSTTTKKTSWAMDKTVKYSAIAVVYTYTDAYVEVKTTSGSFNLYAF